MHNLFTLPTVCIYGFCMILLIKIVVSLNGIEWVVWKWRCVVICVAQTEVLILFR